jgi:hypothetical protein
VQSQITCFFIRGRRNQRAELHTAGFKDGGRKEGVMNQEVHQLLEAGKGRDVIALQSPSSVDPLQLSDFQNQEVI